MYKTCGRLKLNRGKGKGGKVESFEDKYIKWWW